jgi:spore maturation protein CgeB
LTHYYLENEEERRKIAAAGWARAIRDYNEIAVLQKIEQAVEELSLQRRDQTDNDIFIILKKKRMANLIDLFRRLQRWVKELFNLA